MRRPRAILHIGTMKTGTSTLQAVLAGNAEALDRVNYRYLGWPMRHARRIREALGDNDRTQNVLISDEGLWHFCGTKRSDTANIAALLEPYDITVIVYFRRPDEYVESWFAQGLKNGSGLDDLVGFMSNGFVNSRPFQPEQGATDFISSVVRSARRAVGWFQRKQDAADFTSADFLEQIDLSILSKLAYLQKEFRAAEFVVRPFERAQLADGEIVSDFLQTLGPRLGIDARSLTRGQDENVSPPADTILLANLLRRHYGVDEDTIQLFLTTHSPPNHVAATKSRLLRYEEAVAINEAMRPVFCEIQATFGTGATDDFFVDWDVDPDRHHVSPVRDVYDRLIGIDRSHQ